MGRCVSKGAEFPPGGSRVHGPRSILGEVPDSFSGIREAFGFGWAGNAGRALISALYRIRIVLKGGLK